MGYIIQYQKSTDSIYHHTQDSSLFAKLILVASLVMIISILFFGRQKVAAFFIPGEPDMTKAAWNGMIDELENGTAVGEAVITFCQTLIENES